MAAPLRTAAEALAGYRGASFAATAHSCCPLVWLLLAQDAQGFELDIPEPVPWGFHNLFVAALILLITAWAAKVVYQLFVLLILHRRLAFQRALQLNRMSIYAKDFSQLIRQHFNQLLRMRQTVPMREVSRHMLAAHLQPESLKALTEGSQLGLTFAVDAMEPCRARLYWGVSITACDGLIQHTRQPSTTSQPCSVAAGFGHTSLELPESCAENNTVGASAEHPLIDGDADDFFGPSGCITQSRSLWIPAGRSQRCAWHESEFVELSSLGFDLSAPWCRGDQPADRESIVPLVIVVSSASSRRGEPTAGAKQGPETQARHQATLVKFRCEDRQVAWHPEVIHQVVINQDSAHRVLGIYGFEDEDDADPECQICYDQPRSVMLLPCRHCAVCSHCLRSLRDERCPLCRATFSAYLLFPLSRPSPDVTSEAQATPACEPDATEHEEDPLSGSGRSPRLAQSA